jgi:heparan-alpha-glucosaminide N-acetyltransferase
MDAYRGFVMFLMMAEVLHLARVAARVPESGFWKFLAWHQSHVEWIGCSLHDLIQPSFSFLVGVALPFSIASRAARGQSRSAMTWHAIWRALLLVLLGVFLRSTGQNTTITNWTFEDTLSQIGLGYAFLFVLGFRSFRDQWIALGVILVGYWAFFATYPVLPDFDYAKVGVPAAWLETHGLNGFAAHWQKQQRGVGVRHLVHESLPARAAIPV